MSDPGAAIVDTTALTAALSSDGLRLEEEIGRGGTAIVYRAHDAKHDRPVAIKVLRPGVAGAADSERFAREIAVVARLRHPNILPLYDSGTTPEGVRYFVMPLVQGRSLRQRLAAGPMPVEEAVRIASEVADALAFAHAAGVIHRDVKPENILLEAGHAVVADFGLALPLRVAHSDDGRTDRGALSPTGERLTASGFIAGTTDYMSPEQAAGESGIDGRSDSYSLACVVYEMLGGHPPFAGGGAREVLARRFREAPAPLAPTRADVPLALDAAVARALAPAPEDRFASVTEFAAAMRLALRPPAPGEDGVTLPTPRPRPVTATGGRQRLVRGAVVLVSVALLIVAGLALRRRTTRHDAVVLDPNRVVVAVLNNETGDTALDPLAHLVAERIRDGLAGTRLGVVTSTSVIPALRDTRSVGGDMDDPARLGALAEATRAATVVSGSYYRVEGGSLVVIVEITDARSGELLRSIGPVRGRASEADSLAELLRRRVRATMDTLFSPGPASGGSG